MSQNVLTGGRARFFLEGQRMGWAMGVTVTENYQQEPVNVLDNLAPAEFATTAYSVNMRCQMYRVPMKDLVAAQLWPQMGRTPDELKRNILNFPPMSAELYDSHTDTVVGKVFGIVPNSRNIAVNSRGLVASDIGFMALYFADEGSPDV